MARKETDNDSGWCGANGRPLTYSEMKVIHRLGLGDELFGLYGDVWKKNYREIRCVT